MPVNDALVAYIDHRDNCDFLQPMWHQGPCDCGLMETLEELSNQELNWLRSYKPRIVDQFERHLAKKIKPVEVTERRCDSEKCNKVLPPGWAAVYCSTECALEDM